jgi:4-amino-4-deoxy-L-arabinose transferase-like glycosyltransferase
MDGRAALPSRWLGLILFVALGLRLAALAVLHGPDLVTASESGVTAANWVAGRGYTFDFYGYRAAHPLASFMPPLFTALVAMCLLTPWPAAAMGGMQVVLSTLTVLLIYLAAEQLAGRAVGLAAAALTAVYPPFLVLVDQPTVPVLNTFLLALWLWATLRLADAEDAGRQAAWAVLAGLAVGLSVLSRPSALVLLGVTAAALWLWPARRSRRWRPALIAAAAMGLILAPWLVRGVWVHGRPVWISTNGGFSFWNGNNPFTTGSAFDVRVADLEAYTGGESTALPGDEPVVQVKPYPLPLELRGTAATLNEVALDRALYRSAFRFVREQPGRWVRLLGQKLVSLWWFRPNLGRSSGFYQEAWILPYRVMYGAVLAATAAGLVLSLHEWRRYVAIYGLFLASSAVYVAYNAITRYRWEMEPIMLILAAVALVAAVRWATSRRLEQVRVSR